MTLLQLGKRPQRSSLRAVVLRSNPVIHNIDIQLPGALSPTCGSSLLVLALEPLSKGRAIESHDTERSTNNVSEGNGEEILHEEIGDRNLCATHHSQGNDEHVGNGVIKSKRHERRDGEPDGNHLASERRAARCHVHSHADEPVAEDAADKGSLEGQRALGGGNGSTGGGVAEGSRFVREVGKEERSDEVTGVGSDPVFDEIGAGGLALHRSGGDKGGVSSEELSSSDQGHYETERKAEGTKDDLCAWH